MALQKARVKATVYNLGQNQTTTGDTDTLMFHIPDGHGQVSVQTYGTTTSGNITSSYQAYVSNDNVHWTAWDTAFGLAAVVSDSSAVKVLLLQNFLYLKFTLATLTGTGASSTLSVSV